MASLDQSRVPAWSWIAPVAALLLLALNFSGALQAEHALVLALAVALLGGTVFSAVHHAEVLALRLGEPFGSILLAVAVTVIEVALIVSVLITDSPGSETIARDTVYAAVMLVLNGVVGLCLVFGAGRHGEQSFQVRGAAATLAVLGTLATFALVMPNFTQAVAGGAYAPAQLLVVGAVSLVLYAVFVFVQTVRHREYFLDAGAAELPLPNAEIPSPRMTGLSFGLLAMALVGVVLLAKILSKPLDHMIGAAGLPHSLVGVVIASVVLLPEGMSAMKAALANRLQTSINLALGSALASIGLTIPSVAVVSLVIGRPLTLGLPSEDMVLLVLTLFVSTLTLGNGRTTVLQGAVHLVILAIFLLLSVIP